MPTRIHTIHWLQKNMTLGKGYELKMLLSYFQIVYSNILAKKCMFEEFSVIKQRLLTARIT